LQRKILRQLRAFAQLNNSPFMAPDKQQEEQEQEQEQKPPSDSDSHTLA
ncbi:hypothetical protein AWZ03_014905, partial [Drosophila navojoa]